MNVYCLSLIDSSSLRDVTVFLDLPESILLVVGKVAEGGDEVLVLLQPGGQHLLHHSVTTPLKNLI